MSHFENPRNVSCWEWRHTMDTADFTNLWEAWSTGIGGVGGGEANWRVHGALSLLLVDSVSLALRQVEEVLHCFQIHQQWLRGCARVLLLPQDLWQQALDNEDTHLHCELYKKDVLLLYTNFKPTFPSVPPNMHWNGLSQCMFLSKYGTIGYLLLLGLWHIWAQCSIL